MLLNHFFLKIEYFGHAFSRFDKFTRNFKILFSFVGFLYIFSLFTQVQEWNNEKIALEAFKIDQKLSFFLYFSAKLLSNFFRKTYVNHSSCEACESTFEKHDHRFIARSILYTAGLIGDVNKTEILLGNISIGRKKKNFLYTIKINNKGEDTRVYDLDISQNVLQTIKKEEHDSSIVLNCLRKISEKNLLSNNLCKIDKKKSLAWKRKWATAGLFATIGYFIILKISKNSSSPAIILGTLFSSIIGFLFGEYYWKPNKKCSYYHTQPSNEEIDNIVTSWLQPKLTCGVLRLEEEARVISEHLTNNTNLPTWRKRKINIFQNEGLPKDIAELIVEFTP